MGGTQPLKILSELMQLVAEGESEVALLTGAEAIASQRYATNSETAGLYQAASRPSVSAQQAVAKSHCRVATN